MSSLSSVGQRTGRRRYCGKGAVVGHILCRRCIFAGLFLSLRGTPIDGDGFVDADDIGTPTDSPSPGTTSVINNALLCLTGNTACCAGENLNGDWYFPNGTRLESITDYDAAGRTTNIFARSRGQREVRLSRYQSPSERGYFYCELIDINGVNQTIYVNICEYQCSDRYTLECSILVQHGYVTAWPGLARVTGW